MQINVVSCENDEEYYEIIKLLQEKYKDNPNCKFREISDTFILPDKKWIITNKNLVTMLTKRTPETKVFSAQRIKEALLK